MAWRGVARRPYMLLLLLLAITSHKSEVGSLASEGFILGEEPPPNVMAEAQEAAVAASEQAEEVGEEEDERKKEEFRGTSRHVSGSAKDPWVLN